MRLYVMRHGPAEDRAATGRDFDRALTGPGREVVARAARALADDRPSGGALRVLSSPYRRARETAEIVAAISPAHDERNPQPPGSTMGLHPAEPGSAPYPGAVEVEIHDDLTADAPLPLDLVRLLVAEGTDVLLVGHQPTVEELVRELLGTDRSPERSPLPGGFRTGSILVLEQIAPDRWHPAALLDPHQLDR
jgi:phosphohistidine phosphatase